MKPLFIGTAALLLALTVGSAAQADSFHRGHRHRGHVHVYPGHFHYHPGHFHRHWDHYHYHPGHFHYHPPRVEFHWGGHHRGGYYSPWRYQGSYYPYYR